MSLNGFKLIGEIGCETKSIEFRTGLLGKEEVTEIIRFISQYYSDEEFSRSDEEY